MSLFHAAKLRKWLVCAVVPDFRLRLLERQFKSHFALVVRPFCLRFVAAKLCREDLLDVGGFCFLRLGVVDCGGDTTNGARATAASAAT